MKIIDDIYWYEKDLPIGGFIGRGLSSHVYVIDQGDQLWIFDTGVKTLGKAKRILRLMRKDGLDPKLISHIFLTHAHPDHITGLPIFLGYNKEKPPLVGIHKEEIPIMKGGNDALWNTIRESVGPFASIFNPIPERLIKWYIRFSSGPMPHYSPDIVFTEPQTIKGPRFNLDVIPMPGHTPGHTCFFLPQIHLLFGGDLLDFKVYDHSGINLPYSVYEPMVKSLETLCSLQVDHYCGGHFEPMSMGNDANQIRFKNVLTHLYEAKNLVIEFVKKHDFITLAELAPLFPSTDAFLSEQAAIPHAILKEYIRDGKVELINQQFRWIGH